MNIQCSNCNKKYEYDEPKPIQDSEMKSADNLPDGYFRNGNWICDNCGSCPECGKTLEKEKSTLKSLCDECKLQKIQKRLDEAVKNDMTHTKNLAN